MLEIQESLVAMCVAGTTINKLYEAMLGLLAINVVRLGLVPANIAADEHKLKKVVTV